MSHARPRGLIITAPRSGAGKTTLALGLMRALQQDGMRVQPFKVGPDYIDPAFHAAASGRASINLDTWAMRRGLIDDLVARYGVAADVCIVEGVMGLFDGATVAGQSGKGSTADLAALTGWPVVLVLDVWAQAETAAAVALGCKLYRDDVDFAGVVLNGVSSQRHEDAIAPAIRALGLPVLGSMPRRTDINLPERYLGLVQALETEQLDARLNNMAALVRSAVRVDVLLEVAAPLRAREPAPAAAELRAAVPPAQRIALAQDDAFSFVYTHIMMVGVVPAPRLFHSRRLMTKRQKATAMQCGYREDIRSCTRQSFRVLLIFDEACTMQPNAEFPFTANAVVTWCSAPA